MVRGRTKYWMDYSYPVSPVHLLQTMTMVGRYGRKYWFKADLVMCALKSIYIEMKTVLSLLGILCRLSMPALGDSRRFYAGA